MFVRSAISVLMAVLLTAPALAGEPASKGKADIRYVVDNALIEYVVPDKPMKWGKEFIVGQDPKFDVVDTYKGGQGKAAEMWQGSSWDKWSGIASYRRGQWSDRAYYSYDSRYYDFEAYGQWWAWLYPSQWGVLAVSPWVVVGTLVLVLTLWVGGNWRHFRDQVVLAAISARAQFSDEWDEVQALRLSGVSGWPLVWAYVLAFWRPAKMFAFHASGASDAWRDFWRP